MPKNEVLDLKRPVRRAPRATRTQAPLARLGWRPQFLRSEDSTAYEPRVVPVYWDPHFQKSPADVAAFDEFLRTLFRSSWMTALADYGVAPARLLPSFVPNDTPYASLNQPQLEARLTRWLATESILPTPSKAERSLVYLLITPLATKLTLGNLSSSKDFSGYHDCATFARAGDSRGAGGAEKNLFYAAVPLTVTGKTILDAHSRAISKELAESFIDRGHWLGDLGHLPAARRRPARVAV
ncbi:MAG TPA: hypothetical protein VG937_01255 [Polyangiaceae bacterium]|nr:hypothetical protein [Polyangiaceae bacterium]